MADRLSQYVQAYTLYSSVRPFGCSVLLGVHDMDGYNMYSIEPSGVVYGYKGNAVGKGKQLAKTQLEKLDFSTLTLAQAVKEAAKM